ncbi:hypothetical protein VNO78_21521 [Psophocarpus tetragonolobus]|uniref:Uncharacterized protein n=1 Tax=Psophocarpus tetragonolobus TaxID=3891 RepID=A0AAN9XI71_PSOTE
MELVLIRIHLQVFPCKNLNQKIAESFTRPVNYQDKPQVKLLKLYEKKASMAICDKMGLKGYQLNLQTQWRRAQALFYYKQQKKATVALQYLCRARVARKELKKLRMAARETEALKETKDKLEKRVELTWRLRYYEGRES